MTTHRTPATNPHRTTKRRISAKVRSALITRVKERLSWIDCAKRAGLSEAGIHKARKQPHVIEEYERIKAEYVQEVEEMRAPYKARAFEVALELLEKSKSDAVRARMVEFLAGEGKAGGVNVAVQVNNNPAQGYEYAHPNQQVVVIRDADGDTKSPGSSDNDA